MGEKRSRSLTHIRLSPRAVFAAERLAEIAGVPATELVEMVLLELAASGEIVEADVARRDQRSKPVANRGPAAVIPIGRGRRPPPVSPDRRVEALRQRSEAARGRGAAAREASLALRERWRMHPGADG